MSKVLGIFVECFPNPETREYHTSSIIRHDKKSMYGWGHNYISTMEPSEVSKDVRKLYRALNKLPEVKSEIAIYKAYIRIQRNMAFDWETVNAAVAEVLRKHFKADEVDMKLMARLPAWDRQRSEHAGAEWDEEMY